MNEPSVSKKEKNEFLKSFTDFLGSDKNEFVYRPAMRSCNNVAIQDVVKQVKKDIRRNKYYKKILVINNIVCFSACLWIRNVLKLFPNVLIMG